MAKRSSNFYYLRTACGERRGLPATLYWDAVGLMLTVTMDTVGLVRTVPQCRIISNTKLMFSDSIHDTT